MRVAVAAIQLSATPFAVAANLNRAREAVRAAVAGGARIVVLPELFNTGYTFSPHLHAYAERADGVTAAWLIDGATRYGCYLAGGILLREGAEIYSALLLASPSGRLAIYRKMHPCYWEYGYFASGPQPCIAETRYGRFGLLMGADVAYPEPAASYAGQVDLLIISSSAAVFPESTVVRPSARPIPLGDYNRAFAGLGPRLRDDYVAGVARLARQVGAPAVHAVQCGQFRARLPAVCVSPPGTRPSPRNETLVLTTSFLGHSAVYDATGQICAIQPDDEGVVPATVTFPAQDRTVAQIWMESVDSAAYPVA